MVRTTSFCCLLLICSLQIANSLLKKEQARKVAPRKEKPHQVRQHVAIDKFESFDVFQSYPVDRRDTDQTFKMFGTCNGLSGLHETFRRSDKPCRSVLRNCRYDDSMEDFVRFCPSRDKHRRYDFMEVGKKNTSFSKYKYGRNYTSGWCGAGNYENYNRDNYYYPCICDCENSEVQSARYISLAPVVADNGTVVTGVRFRIVDNVLHIQIQQGKIAVNGTIIGQVAWKAIPKPDLRPLPCPQLDDLGYVIKFNPAERFYVVTNDRNTVLLESLRCEQQREVVTGLRFVQKGQDLGLEIETTQVYLNGIFREYSSWVRNQIIDRNIRKEVTLPFSNASAEVSSDENLFVRFQVSDFKTDLGQTTVPFINTKDVVSEKPRALTGVAIALEGKPDLAGSIVLKVRHLTQLCWNNCTYDKSNIRDNNAK